MLEPKWLGERAPMSWRGPGLDFSDAEVVAAVAQTDNARLRGERQAMSLAAHRCP